MASLSMYPPLVGQNAAVAGGIAMRPSEWTHPSGLGNRSGCECGVGKKKLVTFAASAVLVVWLLTMAAGVI